MSAISTLSLCLTFVLQAVLSDRFSTQIAHGTAALDAEAQARERNERRMTENMKSNTDDLEATLTDARQQLQFSIENVSKTTEEKFGAAHAAIEASIRAAKDEDANIRTKITEEVFNLDRKVEDELKRRQVEQDKVSVCVLLHPLAVWYEFAFQVITCCLLPLICLSLCCF